jgi:hypothetical protein
MVKQQKLQVFDFQTSEQISIGYKLFNIFDEMLYQQNIKNFSIP